MDAEPYYKRLTRLRKARSLTNEELAHLVHDEPISHSHIVALQQNPNRSAKGNGRTRSRGPSAEAIEILAPALGVAPEEFPEYRLAMARRLLDERQVGLDQALANLARSGLATPTAASDEPQPAVADVPEMPETRPGQLPDRRQADRRGSDRRQSTPTPKPKRKAG